MWLLKETPPFTREVAERSEIGGFATSWRGAKCVACIKHPACVLETPTPPYGGEPSREGGGLVNDGVGLAAGSEDAVTHLRGLET